MPLIKPVSDLRNYPEVLKGVKIGQPVYLTKTAKAGMSLSTSTTIPSWNRRHALAWNSCAGAFPARRKDGFPLRPCASTDRILYKKRDYARLLGLQ